MAEVNLTWELRAAPGTVEVHDGARVAVRLLLRASGSGPAPTDEPARRGLKEEVLDKVRGAPAAREVAALERRAGEVAAQLAAVVRGEEAAAARDGLLAAAAELRDRVAAAVKPGDGLTKAEADLADLRRRLEATSARITEVERLKADPALSTGATAGKKALALADEATALAQQRRELEALRPQVEGHLGRAREAFASQLREVVGAATSRRYEELTARAAEVLGRLALAAAPLLNEFLAVEAQVAALEGDRRAAAVAAVVNELLAGRGGS